MGGPNWFNLTYLYLVLQFTISIVRLSNFRSVGSCWEFPRRATPPAHCPRTSRVPRLASWLSLTVTAPPSSLVFALNPTEVRTAYTACFCFNKVHTIMERSWNLKFGFLALYVKHVIPPWQPDAFSVPFQLRSRRRRLCWRCTPLPGTAPSTSCSRTSRSPCRSSASPTACSASRARFPCPSTSPTPAGCTLSPSLSRGPRDSKV